MTRREAPKSSPGLRFLIEIGPLVAFFITNSRADLFWATGVFMVAITLSLIASRVLEKRWPVMPLFTGIFVLVLGGLTLALHDETFIKLKPTIVNVLFAGILFAGLARGRSLLRVAFGTAFDLDDEGWRLLTLRWAFFFLVLAGLNEVVWRSVSTDAWVKFKVFGVMPITFAFMISQMGLLKRHGPQEEAAPDEASDPAQPADNTDPR
ncbi:MAG: intracellular septation protein [Chlamydiales bacterium]|jgi:intracellular septation protein